MSGMDEKSGDDGVGASASLGTAPRLRSGRTDVEAAAEPDNIVPGNRRRMQRRRARGRELFGKTRKEAFLGHLSETANVAASAEAAGVAVGTVYAHRLKDEEFRDLWWAALEQGTAKLVALRLQREIERAEGRLAPELEARMDGPPDPKLMSDHVKLLTALRDLTRGLAGEASPGAGRAGGRGRRGDGPGRAPQAAGLDETCRALAKRLKAFGVRAGVVPAVVGGAGG